MNDLTITGLGMVCPVGLNAIHACAAIRADVCRLAEYQGYFCREPEGPMGEVARHEPEPVIAGRVPPMGNLSDDARGEDRLLQLSLPVLQEIFTTTGLSRKQLQRAALLVALPTLDPGIASWKLGGDFIGQLCERSGVDEWAIAKTVAGGPAGALAAIETGRQLLGAGDVELCVLLTVDTLVSPDRLGYLDEHWRLRSQRNPDGLLPGEAAAGLLIEETRAVKRRRAAGLACLGPIGRGQEPATVSGERWSTAQGLCQAIRPLLEGPQGIVGAYTLCNLNGEAYTAHEWGLAQVRLAHELPVVEALVHPADSIGDAGTAMAGVLVACACQSYVHGYAPGRAALVWVGSDDGGRAAMVVRPWESRS